MEKALLSRALEKFSSFAEPEGQDLFAFLVCSPSVLPGASWLTMGRGLPPHIEVVPALCLSQKIRRAVEDQSFIRPAGDGLSEIQAHSTGTCAVTRECKLLRSAQQNLVLPGASNAGS